MTVDVLMKRFVSFPEALVFLTNDRAHIGGGRIIELLGIGKALAEDESPDDPDNGKPFIHGQAVDLECVDSETWYYYNADEVIPLTVAAREAWAELIYAQANWLRRRNA